MLSQTVVQDFIHLYMDSRTIETWTFSCHLVEEQDADDPFSWRYYAVAYCEEHPQLCRGTMPSSWRALQSEPSLRVSIEAVDHQGNPCQDVECQASFASETCSFEVKHPAVVIELIVREYHHRSLTFLDSSAVDPENAASRTSIRLAFQKDLGQDQRKFEAAAAVLRDAPFRPSPLSISPYGGSLIAGASHLGSMLPDDLYVLKRLQSFHCEFWQGKGFWYSSARFPSMARERFLPPPRCQESLLKSLEDYTALRPGTRLTGPPSISLVATTAPASLTGSILDSLLPEYREAFYCYMSSVPMGVAVITGFSGSGKSQTLAVAVVAMALKTTIGCVYATSPTNVGVSHLARLIDNVSRAVVDRQSESDAGGNIKLQHLLVVRGHSPHVETERFIDCVAEDPYGNLDGAQSGTKWSAHLSGAYWLLKIFQSDLSDADPVAIHDVAERNRDAMDTIKQKMHRIGTNKGRGNEFERRGATKLARRVLEDIVYAADVLCTTPALSANSLYDKFNRFKARGVALDDANAMSRVDALLLWGNTGRPAAMAGDDKLMSPTIRMTDTRYAKPLDDEWDSHRGYEIGPYNRMAEEGEVSILDWTLKQGWEQLVLSTQVRAANGLFDIAARQFYFGMGRATYAASTAVHTRDGGLRVERFLSGKHNLRVRKDKFSPVFVHCKSTREEQDARTLSWFNTGQLHIVVKFLRDLRSIGISLSDIVILTPYSANVSALQKLLRHERELKKVLCTTVDSYQGKQAKVVFYVFTITTPSHAAFAADPRRLNTAMTRAQDALFLIGNLELSINYAVQTKHIPRGAVEPVEAPADDETECLEKMIAQLAKSGRMITELYEPPKEVKVQPKKGKEARR